PRPTATPLRASPTPSGTLGSGSIGPCPGKTVTSGSGSLVTDQSTNWSGYAATPDTARVTCIESSWTQPTVTCSKSGHSAISVWVGIGGFDQDALEQVGSEVDCDNGKASHFLWHESLPRERFEQRLDLLVRAGDHLRVRVRAISSTRYELAIANVTRSTSFTVVDTNTRIKATSGEWILEAPTGGCPSACKILPMPNFHKFTFKTTWVTVGGVRQPLDGTSFTHVRVRMVTKSGTIRSQVTSTAGDGSSFVVTWRRS
ncbi:MAG: G1 family glutamic endopeptidase, partial [Candidatus Limnocylindrales bacterium]